MTFGRASDQDACSVGESESFLIFFSPLWFLPDSPGPICSFGIHLNLKMREGRHKQERGYSNSSNSQACSVMRMTHVVMKKSTGNEKEFRT